MAKFLTETVLRRIDKLAAHRPDLAPPLELYRRWYALLDRRPPIAAPVVLSHDEADRKLAKGLPLLSDCQLQLNLDVAESVFLDLLDLLLELDIHAAPHLPARLSSLRKDVASQQVTLTEIMEAVVGQTSQDRFCYLSIKYDLEPSFITTVLTILIRPIYMLSASSLSDLLTHKAWARGYCPICGSPPTIGELQGKEGALHLRCGTCGSDWPFPRVRCHVCGNSDPQTLGILQLYDEPEAPFVRTCTKCRDYVKIITSFAPTSPELIPIEDLATLELDFIAQGASFSHAGASSDALAKAFHIPHRFVQEPNP